MGSEEQAATAGAWTVDLDAAVYRMIRVQEYKEGKDQMTDNARAKAKAKEEEIREQARLHWYDETMYERLTHELADHLGLGEAEVAEVLQRAKAEAGEQGNED